LQKKTEGISHTTDSTQKRERPKSKTNHTNNHKKPKIIRREKQYILCIKPK
jgi:hypothetical protein